MAETALLVAGVSTLLVAAVYAAVGHRLLALVGSKPADALAIRMFAAWWMLTAANQVGGALLNIGAAFGQASLALQLTYTVAQRLLLAAALVSLLYYLIYLQTGRDALRPLSVVYGAFFVFSLWNIFVRGPVDIGIYRWRTELAYAAPPVAWASMVTFIVIVVPPVIAALSLLHIYPKVSDRAKRMRIVAVAVGLTLWWTVAVIAGLPGALDADQLQVFNRLVGLVVALGILVAYRPTAWMTRRLHLAPQTV